MASCQCSQECTRDETCCECIRYENAALSFALREIGNVVGGPTMTYDPLIEAEEWHDRAGKISRIVVDALRPPDALSGVSETHRTTEGK